MWRLKERQFLSGHGRVDTVAERNSKNASGFLAQAVAQSSFSPKSLGSKMQQATRAMPGGRSDRAASGLFLFLKSRESQGKIATTTASKPQPPLARKVLGKYQ